jgi:hypothetical protein
MRGMGVESSSGTTDPSVERGADSDGSRLRSLAFVVFVAAVALNVLLVVLTLTVPALLWCRLLGTAALGVVAGSAIWPSRRKEWLSGPDTAWLLRASAWALVFALGGLAMSVLDAITGG